VIGYIGREAFEDCAVQQRSPFHSEGVRVVWFDEVLRVRGSDWIMLIVVESGRGTGRYEQLRSRHGG